MLRTRIFDLMPYFGFRSQRELALRLEVHEATLSRIKSGEIAIGGDFISKAVPLFPGKTIDDLFYIEDEEREPAEVAGA